MLPSVVEHSWSVAFVAVWGLWALGVAELVGKDLQKWSRVVFRATRKVDWVWLWMSAVCALWRCCFGLGTVLRAVLFVALHTAGVNEAVYLCMTEMLAIFSLLDFYYENYNKLLIKSFFFWEGGLL